MTRRRHLDLMSLAFVVMGGCGPTHIPTMTHQGSVLTWKSGYGESMAAELVSTNGRFVVLLTTEGKTFEVFSTTRTKPRIHSSRGELWISLERDSPLERDAELRVIHPAKGKLVHWSHFKHKAVVVDAYSCDKEADGTTAYCSDYVDEDEVEDLYNWID